MADRKNPLRQILDVAAASGEPLSRLEIARHVPFKDDVTPAERRQCLDSVVAATIRMAAVKADGDNRGCRRIGADTAEHWRHLVGAPPRPDDHIADTDARGLAAAIDRRRIP